MGIVTLLKILFLSLKTSSLKKSFDYASLNGFGGKSSTRTQHYSLFLKMLIVKIFTQYPRNKVQFTLQLMDKSASFFP